MKLEEGKWYKWFHTSHATYHIGKYFNCPGEGFVKMKPWLDSSKQYEIAGTFESKFMQDIVEITDLTEIQKLLPDGHEDKVDKIAKPKFMVGKWYKNLNYGKDWIAKAISDSRMSGDHFYHGDYITNDKVFNERSISKSNLIWNEDTVECPLSEIQQYLPDGHVDKIGSSSKRYIATMKFFNELREPERSEAIKNYNENYDNSVPSTLTNALGVGFCWGGSAQGHAYWESIRLSIGDNTYFKELESKTLVFGKYKVGDVVVSLTAYGSSREEGSLFTVKEKSAPHKLCYDTCFCNSLPNDWRLATPEEVEAYNSGIKNIADIKLTSLEGRYIKCLKENNWIGRTKVGDVLKIRKSDSVGDLFIGDRCLDKSRLKNGEFELLPIDYSPDLIKEEQTMFKKGDYIVTLINQGGCGKVNYCSKQRRNEKHLIPEIDTRGDTDNGNSIFAFSDNSQTKWRFATKEEGEEYERHGKPYDVGSLLSSKIPDKPSDLITRDVSIFNTSRFYGDHLYSYPLTPKETHPNYSLLPVPINIILKTKSKSIKL